MRSPHALPLALALAASAAAQGTAADYERAAALGDRFDGKLERFRPAIRFLEGGAGVWWRERGDGASLYVRVDGATGERRESADPAALGLPSGDDALEPRSRFVRSGSNGPRTRVTFENSLDETVELFWVDRRRDRRSYGTVDAGASRELSTFSGHAWLATVPAEEGEERGDVVGAWIAEDWDAVARIDAASRRAANERGRFGRRRGGDEGDDGDDDAGRPYRVERVEHDLVRVDADGAREPLTTGGTEEDPYLGRIHYSPDGLHALAFRETVVEERRIPLVESSPRDDDEEGEVVQPVLHWHDYRKPGDELPQRRPCMLDLAGGSALAVDGAPFEDTYSVRFLRWSPDGARAYVMVNTRGHQRLVVHAIEAATGALTTVVDERSETFVDYSQKTELHWLDGAGQLLWASERDGRNHLYRIDATTGEVVNQVTSGDYVVRDVEHVDEEAGEVWFTAYGIHPDQDPYHAHLARVDLDGTGLVALTEADGTHDWELDEDRTLLVARWSRVDHPTVTELRDARTGALVTELGRDDATELLAAGFSYPERFVAKGRDGETDVHGIVVLPTNFDPRRRYPVIEKIYAGPHGFHVPKSFGLHTRTRRVAELGFVVVQIDGMGTNWRTKAFHDVCWQNLADAGFPDRIAWMRAAAAERPWMDLERVGIYGGSAGGQNALGALLFHGDFYDAAAADCGCHDNRMDKIWWNEAWMGAMGPHYAENSNVTHAHELEGDLLLTVGELDRNVDPASTLQVVDALVRARKDFEFVLVPGAGHGVGESPYLFRRRQDFFVRSLYGVEPRE